MRIGTWTINFTSNGRKYGWGFWRSLWNFFVVKPDSIFAKLGILPHDQDGHIRCEGAAQASLKGNVLKREFYTFRAFKETLIGIPIYELRKGAESLAEKLGLSKELAYQIGAISMSGDATGDVIEGGVTTNSFTYTVNSGSNLCLIIGSGYSDANRTLDSGSWRSGAEAISEAIAFFDTNANSGRAVINYLVNPTPDTEILGVTFSGNLVAGDRGGQTAVTYSGVLQADPIGITGSNTSGASGVTSIDTVLNPTEAENSWIFSNYWWGGGGDISPGQGETHRVEQGTGIENGGGDKTTTTVGSYTTGWDSASSNSVVMTAAEIKAAVVSGRRIIGRGITR